MLWLKALHLIFMVTWFAGLLLLIPDIGLPDRVRGRMSTNKVRTRSHSLCSRVSVHRHENRLSRFD